jgi:hypothetical protein
MHSNASGAAIRKTGAPSNYLLRWMPDVQRLSVVPMNQTHAEQKACDRKSQYAGLGPALSAAKRFAMRDGLEGDLRAYLCGNHWHLGRWYDDQ